MFSKLVFKCKLSTPNCTIIRNSVHLDPLKRSQSIFKKAKLTITSQRTSNIYPLSIRNDNAHRIPVRKFLYSNFDEEDRDPTTSLGSTSNSSAIRAVKRKLKKETITSAVQGYKSVVAAIVTNFLVASGKLVGFFFTGSGSLLSEAIHSLADTANQTLLCVGIWRSLKGPDKDHPYGHGPEQFVWALISAVGIFFVGSGLTIYHGVATLLHPQPLHSIELALATLLGSLVLEGISLFIAVQECSRLAKEQRMTFREYINKGSDMSTIAVLMEDSAAILGVAVAGTCVGLTHITGNPMYDSIGSIMVGGLLGSVASFLVYRNKEALVGRSIAPDQLEKILALMRSDPVIRNVYNVKAITLSSQILRFQAEVDFDGEEVARRYLLKQKLDMNSLKIELNTSDKLENFLIKYGDGVIDALGLEVDRIEEAIRREVPEVKFVDLETY